MEGSVPPPTEGDTAADREQNVEKFRRCFQHYYATLCDVLPTDEMLPLLISSEVITMEEMLEIEAKETSSLRARALLSGPIWRAINGGFPDTFVRFLFVMSSLRIQSCKELCEKICLKLGITAEVIAELSSKQLYFGFTGILGSAHVLLVSRPDVLCGDGGKNVWSLLHTFCEPCRNVDRANENALRNL